MSKLKNYMMNIDQTIEELYGFPEILNSSLDIQDIKKWVFDKLDIISNFDKCIAESHIEWIHREVQNGHYGD